MCLCLGLDINSLKAHVDWETFLKLYCIFEVGNIQQSKLITFWCKFFDTDMLGICPKVDYEDLLEKLVCGKCLPANNEFSNIFKENFIQQL
jgi:hypothetical protein